MNMVESLLLENIQSNNYMKAVSDDFAFVDAIVEGCRTEEDTED